MQVQTPGHGELSAGERLETGKGRNIPYSNEENAAGEGRQWAQQGKGLSPWPGSAGVSGGKAFSHPEVLSCSALDYGRACDHAPSIMRCHPTEPQLSCRGSDGCFTLQLDELQLCKNCFYLSNARPDNWFCYPCVCGILSFSFIGNCLDSYPLYLRMIIPMKYIYIIQSM